MGRINNCVKLFVLKVNTFSAMFALTLIALSIYIVVSDWGSLDKTFFEEWCIVLILFGIIVTLISSLGCTGVMNQTKSAGCWTGRRVLAIYQLILIGALIAELYAVIRMSDTLVSLRKSKRSINTDSPLEYDNFESAVALRFNAFYFGAISTCTNLKYHFFWKWVNNHCPSEISQDVCEKCYSYTVTTCVADKTSCYANDNSDKSNCPYELCRSSALSYLINHLSPFAYFTFAFAGFQFILMVLSCLLICFHEGESQEEILMRTGGAATNSVSLAHIQMSHSGSRYQMKKDHSKSHHEVNAV